MESATIRCLPVATKVDPNASFTVHINSERFPIFSIDGACGLLKYTKEAEFVPLNEEHPRTFIYFR